jgi:hypothetical protein
MKSCALLTASLLLASTVTAQEPSDRDDRFRVRADGIEVLVVAENPFSARYSIDSSRSLDDGSVQTMHVDTTVARDSEGRVYREHHSLAPGNSDNPALQTFSYSTRSPTREHPVTSRRGTAISRATTECLCSGQSQTAPSTPAIVSLRARTWGAMLFMVSTSSGRARPLSSGMPPTWV